MFINSESCTLFKVYTISGFPDILVKLKNYSSELKLFKWLKGLLAKRHVCFFELSSVGFFYIWPSPLNFVSQSCCCCIGVRSVIPKTGKYRSPKIQEVGLEVLHLNLPIIISHKTRKKKLQHLVPGRDWFSKNQFQTSSFSAFLMAQSVFCNLVD